MKSKQISKLIRSGPAALLAAARGLSRQGRRCPYCSGKPVVFSPRGHLSQVLECPSCSLLYGWPKQDSGFNRSFYQKKYSDVHRCSTTDLPDPAGIEAMACGRFASIGKNIDWVIELFTRLGPKGALLDYGCSWGYAVRQFKDAGFAASGLEVSRGRAAFGREHLNVPIYDQPEKLIASGGRFDFIYTSHVLEHLPDPGIALRLFSEVANPGCILLIRVPNCGGANARSKGVRWGPFSSKLHPLSYRAAFFERNLPKHGFEVKLVASDPYDPRAFADAVRNGSDVHADGEDLIICAVRTL